MIDIEDSARRYAVIIGHGRSGTNLSLDILDCHPNTICRNEPGALAGCAMNGLPGKLEDGELPDNFPKLWREALDRSCVSRGARDRGGRMHKSYYTSHLGACFVEGVLPHTRVRKALGLVDFGLGGNEWDVGKFQKATNGAGIFPVYKILLRPHWVLNTHATDTGQFVIHVMREPLGMIKSWRGRYVSRAKGGPAAVHAANMATIDKILDHFGGKLKSGEPFSESSLVETELWRWRYMNEVAYRALAASDRYRVWTYSDLMCHRQETAEEGFAWLGLSIDAGTQKRLQSMTNTLFHNKPNVPTNDEMVRDLMGHVLEDSPLSAYCAPR